MDYSEVIRRFKDLLTKNGIEETADDPFFREASEDQVKYLSDLYGTFNYWTSVYLDDELETLKNYRVPDHITAFYQKYNPNVSIEKAGIFLFDLDRIKDENSICVPGAVLIKYGLITIATSIGGMAVCMDLNVLHENEPRIVIIDLCDCNDVDDVECYEDVQEISHLVAPSFSEFIWKLSGDEYDDFEDTFVDTDE